MRFTLALLFAGVASASLVSRQTVPQCALDCIAAADLGDCSATDNVCLCNNESFVSSTAACIQSTCTGDDLAAAIAFAQATCEGAGVTLTTDSSAGSATDTASVSDTASASGSTSTTPSTTNAITSSSTTSSATAASESASETNAARSNGVPVLAAAALGLAAFAL